ncbi:RNA polymerase sigma factor [Sulfurospirillum barnesii]|uniref:RNA polymerase sigma factor n=1 Tax=Sulfurospirillum barnesii (strain ATCC 700032 / DSM 10660 / SES-3) TaxID=760154 RepID=I3XZB2_SULBS|nr:RNA polymerase sigma factor [Sulfurospirillum barnesii]AFL69286.1 RNA polymerase sigma factor, sigma-70 family [Sulfurospirillum barnesii SES-3]
MLEYYDEILCYTQRLTGDKVLAQDLTQETYIKVLEARKKSNMIIQKAFLYKVARNLVIDKVRKDKIVHQMPYEEEKHCGEVLSNTQERVDEQIRQETLKACIKNLSPQNKKAFVLYYYKGYSRQEIAQMMGISTNAVEKNITRAVLQLKEQIAKEHP